MIDDQKEFDHLRKFVYKNDQRVSDIDILRMIFLNKQKTYAGKFTQVARIKKLIDCYNAVITHIFKINDGDLKIINRLTINRDTLINNLVTEYLKLGVPVKLLPDKERLKNVN